MEKPQTSNTIIFVLGCFCGFFLFLGLVSMFRHKYELEPIV